MNVQYSRGCLIMLLPMGELVWQLLVNMASGIHATLEKHTYMLEFLRSRALQVHRAANISMPGYWFRLNFHPTLIICTDVQVSACTDM